ncbi:DUF354 domain-containing protein [Methanosarcina mazei]|uniref:DUF354 domain-containing protein n=1 Tax=Methanosarcina mazei TaxID=2209 RepID=UPI00064EAA7E|nr:DUF354 domain-containing protein [Methanosarcina mazei]
MRVLIDVGHPGHVHFFKNAIWNLREKGHEVMVTSRNKEVTIDLLNAYGIPHNILTSTASENGSVFKEWMVRDCKFLNVAKKFNPDILAGIMNPCVAHASWLLRKKAFIFNDTEHQKFARKITNPFVEKVYTPSCYYDDFGKKQVRYEGYHELAYLHPNRFSPNPAVLEEMGLKETDTIIILRFVSWKAHHDVGQAGIKNKVKLVNELEKYGHVFITSEQPLGPELDKYKIRVSPEKLHDLLYYATLYIGEGATTASECAVLGTHAVYVNTLRTGYTNEEESKYGLVFNFSEGQNMEEEAFRKALDLLKNQDLKSEGRKKREKLLNDKIDVTGFMVKEMENAVL